MSTKLVSTGVQFPDSSIQTTSTTGGSTTFDGMSDTTVSTTDPAIDTNPSATGHIWLNKTSGEYYICTDNTAGSNVWTNVGEGVDGVAPIVWYGDRAVWAGGSGVNIMDYVSIPTTSNATDFGDLLTNKSQTGWCSAGARGVIVDTASMEYITFATTGNATDFGDATVAGQGSCSNGIRGVIPDSTWATIEYITIATTGNAIDFGDKATRYTSASTSNDVRGIMAGGWIGASYANYIEYLTIATTGNATDFGDLTVVRWLSGSLASDTRACFFDGWTGSYQNVIDYVTIATTGNATDFGDLITASRATSGTSNITRGVIGGGSQDNTTISYITIATTGNATDFGDLTVGREWMAAGSGA